MKFNQLQTTKRPSQKRVGRGIGAGQGKTAGRGTKGQNARTGGGVRLGFEGGQNRLAKRLPKQPGFTSHFPEVQIIHTDQLNSFSAGTTVDVATLHQQGLIQNLKDPVKLLARGELTTKLTLEIHMASKSAAKIVEAAKGGVAILPERVRKTKPEVKQV